METNKPVAWINLRCGGIVTFDAVWASKVDDKKPIPLYTHLVELTDEEIHKAIRRGFARDGFLSDGIFLEIKELLRKASEK